MTIPNMPGAIPNIPGDGVNVIAASRRENLPWWGRLILFWLPRRVYRQVLREYDIGLAAHGWAIDKSAADG